MRHSPRTTATCPAAPFRRAGVVGVIGVAAAAVLLLAGCFETTLNLGSADDAKVDVQYVGDWHFTWKTDEGETNSADLVVRNFDGKRYYAEWKQSGEKPLRFNGFLVPVKTATFAQLTPLGEKGELSDTHLIVRVQLEGTKLIMRHLDREFFADVNTDAGLRKKVEENLDNAKMYAASATGSLIGQP
jgi:hypothetical protein